MWSPGYSQLLPINTEALREEVIWDLKLLYAPVLKVRDEELVEQLNQIPLSRIEVQSEVKPNVGTKRVPLLKEIHRFAPIVDEQLANTSDEPTRLEQFCEHAKFALAPDVVLAKHGVARRGFYRAIEQAIGEPFLYKLLAILVDLDELDESHHDRVERMAEALKGTLEDWDSRHPAERVSAHMEHNASISTPTPKSVSVLKNTEGLLSTNIVASKSDVTPRQDGARKNSSKNPARSGQKRIIVSPPKRRGVVDEEPVQSKPKVKSRGFLQRAKSMWFRFVRLLI
eukprot:Blabericola_migrator_1__2739@NODE_1781_length_3801_cov_113_225228_g1147_i0_p2_GENE_NODE_1781_length_3801_cov_113_225228_g1147_i0NODE_1781_length_3801_cov_113_225228_g1147_i0_p2_ORF_typecomplete_len284_score45_88_NODE_1781_length_3801_cov_113_225228_g1147_i017562607